MRDWVPVPPISVPPIQSRILTDQIIRKHFWGAGGRGYGEERERGNKGEKERRVGRKEREN